MAVPVDVIKFEKIFPDVREPHRFHDGDAAFDVYANEDRTIESGQWQVCATGLKMSVPHGYVAMVLSRSGMAANDGLFVLNAPGLVDPNYRGEIKVNIMNMGPQRYKIKKGDRIAQLLVLKYAESNSIVVDEIDPPPDDRGTGGFGSTGR